MARAAHADSVKFQIIYPESLYLTRILRNGQYEDNEVVEMRRRSMLSDDEYRELADYCRQQGIAMSASIFDPRGLALLNEFDPPYIKIASCDLNNSRLLKQAAELGRRLILSTGMSTLGEVEEAVTDVLSTGHTDIVLMHCVSVYPCPTEKMNLGFLEVLRSAFGLPVGLSDHTEKSLAAAVAVSRGVTWIEKHFTLDRSAEGFDHAYAMEPNALAAYVSDVRSVEAACARPPEKLGEVESEVKTRARRGIFAARQIEPGETISEEDLLVVRPESCLRPNTLGELIGKVAQRAIQPSEPITRDHLCQS